MRVQEEVQALLHGEGVSFYVRVRRAIRLDANEPHRLELLDFYRDRSA